MQISAKDRKNIWETIRNRLVPYCASLRSKAKGMDNPIIKMNIGNTTSASSIPSTPLETCPSLWGTSRIVHKSLPKISSSIVSPRKTSIETNFLILPWLTWGPRFRTLSANRLLAMKVILYPDYIRFVRRIFGISMHPDLRDHSPIL